MALLIPVVVLSLMAIFSAMGELETKQKKEKGD